MKTIVRKNIIALSMVVMIIGSMFIGSNKVYAASDDTVVYITKTGECYHSDGCSSLRKSKIATTLKSAVDKGYRPCSKCHPGTLDAASSSTTTTKAATTKTAAATTAANSAVEALKKYKGNTKDFNAYTYYTNYADLQTAIGADGDKLLKHFNEFGKAEGRVAK